MTKSITLVVSSNNPVKINAAEVAFRKAFGLEVDVISCNANSDVSDQPMSYEETRQGALNRVEHAKQMHDGDYYIGYEGGVEIFEDGPKTFAIVCIANAEKTVFGQSATLPLPISIYEQLTRGVELGSAMDELFKTVNIKQKGGAIGQLTKGLETRQSVYTSATILALSPFLYESLY